MLLTQVIEKALVGKMPRPSKESWRRLGLDAAVDQLY